MKNDDMGIIRKIISYCNDIEVLMKEYNSSFDAYKEKIAFQYSCNMCIIQIGELVSRFSDDFLDSHKDIPWHAIKAMRNLHAHDYEKVDFDIVWESLTKEIPDLKEKLESML